MIFNIVIMLAVLWICVYTFSFGVWTWRKRNKFGALMVMLISLIALMLPIINLFMF